VSAVTLPVPRVAARPASREHPARVAEIITAARDLLETAGPDALTMRRLGEVVGIRAASLYKHLPGKPAVAAALIDSALAELGETLHLVVDGSGPRDAVPRLLASYRRFALAHPNLYRLAATGPLAREQLTPGVEEWAGEPFYRVTGNPYVAQALWAAAHGTVILELDRRYPDGSDLDATWHALAEVFTAAKAG
jgi:AcrR family transcriptional regulator